MKMRYVLVRFLLIYGAEVLEIGWISLFYELWPTFFRGK